MRESLRTASLADRLVETTPNVSSINSLPLVNVNGCSEPVWYSACHTDTMDKVPNTRLVEWSDSCSFVMTSHEFTPLLRSSTDSTRTATCRSSTQRRLFSVRSIFGMITNGTVPPPTTSTFFDDKTCESSVNLYVASIYSRADGNADMWFS